MNSEFWLDRWRLGQIGFHKPAVDRNLLEYWSALGVPPAGRVLVPLCGKSVDLLWLRDQGYAVQGIELSDIALQSFFLEHGLPVRRRAHGEVDVYESNNLRLLRGDVFCVDAALCGRIDAVYDRAALISWAPELRDKYVEHVTALTELGTETLLIAVEYAQAQMPGPPFAIDTTEVHRLYRHHHVIQELGRRDTLHEESRFQERGVTRFEEVCYRLTRV